MSQQQTGAAEVAEAKAPRPARTPAEIEADIERTRDSLAGSIDQLQDRLSPGALADAAKAKALSVFQRPDGSVDPIRAGAALGLTILLVAYFVRRRGL